MNIPINRLIPTDSISPEHPLIIILPNGRMIIQESGCANICFEQYVGDDRDGVVFESFEVYMNHFKSLKTLEHGGMKRYLRLKRKEKKLKKRSGGKNGH